MTEHFLYNYESEILSHDLIMQDNLRAMKEHKAQIVDHSDYVTKFLLIQSSDVCKSIEANKESIQIKRDYNEMLMQLKSVSRDIVEKEKDIQNLEDQIKQRTAEFDSYKSKQEKQHRANRSTLNVSQKALKPFTQHFQYTINTEHLNEADKYGVVITFTVNKKESKYPIKFIFDRQTDNLLSFNTGLLLTQEEETTLSNFYRAKRNNLALFCTLRDIVFMKENV